MNNSWDFKKILKIFDLAMVKYSIDCKDREYDPIREAFHQLVLDLQAYFPVDLDECRKSGFDLRKYGGLHVTIPGFLGMKGCKECFQSRKTNKWRTKCELISTVEKKRGPYLQEECITQ